MSITPPDEHPVAARALFPGAQDFAIRHVVGGNLNMYNTVYRDAPQTTPPRSSVTQETISNTQLPDTASSFSWEVSAILYRLLRPFWIYPRGDKRDFLVSSLDDDSDAPSSKKTSGEVYVYTMLHAGQGLPCWKPRPREPLRAGEGVTPGDVGIFSVEGGFKKIFNLWDDKVAIQGSPAAGSYHIPYEIPPKPRILTNTKELAEGKALVEGVWYETFYGSDGQTIEHFEFHHLETHQQGALLAMTSPGKLEELDESANGLDLQDFIARYAGLLYKYANAIRSIKAAEALYIVTGCIKSESWALAAFRDPVLHPGHVPRLVRLPGGQSNRNIQDPAFGWRSQGTFDSNVGKSEAIGSQDQTLFLRGYKLDFSQSFRSQAKRGQTPFTKGHDWGGDSSFGSPDSKGSGCGGQTGDNPHGEGGEGSNAYSWEATGGTGGHSEVDDPAGDCFVVTSFPDDSHQESCHPCDIINKFLLKETGMDFALSHDDDWRSVLEVQSKSDLATEPNMQERFPHGVSVQHGVASLSSHGSRDKSTQAAGVSPAMPIVRPLKADMKACGTGRGDALNAPGHMVLPARTIGPEDMKSSTGVHASPKDNTFNEAEERSQFVCKFFKHGNCNAGTLCLYSHDLTDKKQICYYFRRGNCRYGHMCALAHTLPGQDISMDEENKAAARLAAVQRERGADDSKEGDAGESSVPVSGDHGSVLPKSPVWSIDDEYCLTCGRRLNDMVSEPYCSAQCRAADTIFANGSHSQPAGRSTDEANSSSLSPPRRLAVGNHAAYQPYQGPRPVRRPTQYIPPSVYASRPANVELQLFRQAYSQSIPRPYSPSVESHTTFSDVFSQRSESTQPTEYSDLASPPPSPSSRTSPILRDPIQPSECSGPPSPTRYWNGREWKLQA